MQARRSKVLKRGAGAALAVGFAVAGAGCFLPGTGQLTVFVAEDFETGGPPAFTFDRDTYTVPHGDIDVRYFGPGGSTVPHDLKIEGQESAFLNLPANADAVQGAIDLDAGTYPLFCSMGTHRALGMEAQLVVL